jgi:GTP-binding protein
VRPLSAEFVTSVAAGAEGIPHDGLSQVAFVGRSNVGKSSLINALSQSTIARTSAAPGKTRLANVYRLIAEGGAGGPGRWSVYFVDLPGYGYARGGGDAADELRAVAESYFRASQRLGPERGDGVKRRGAAPPSESERGWGTASADKSQQTPQAIPRVMALHLVDSRHPDMESDVDAARWLAGSNVTQHVVVATKIDKLSRADRVRNLRTIGNVFGMTAVPVSVTSGEGLDVLWRMIATIARGVEPRG